MSNPLKSAQRRHDNREEQPPDEWIVRFSDNGWWMITDGVRVRESFGTRHEAEQAARQANEKQV